MNLITSKPLVLFFSFLLFLLFSNCAIKNNFKKDTNLVTSNTWYIAGPSATSQKEINSNRIKNNEVSVTTNDNPVGEIELNVMITNSGSNDGIPANLPSESRFVTIRYQSSQEIKLQAREGNESGTGCVHGGNHAMITLPASPDTFKTIKIPWTDFKLNEKPLNIHNLCKFNFVNYHPKRNSKLIISLLQLEKF